MPYWHWYLNPNNIVYEVCMHADYAVWITGLIKDRT